MASSAERGDFSDPDVMDEMFFFPKRVRMAASCSTK